jgi:folate-dependent phosphoribosylglycinamide formyltransferase PurN
MIHYVISKFGAVTAWSRSSAWQRLMDWIGEVDCGEPIVTEEVDLRPENTLEDLEARMHTVEHHLIVEGARIALERLYSQKGITTRQTISQSNGL